MQHGAPDVYCAVAELNRQRCEADVLYKLLFSDDNAALFRYTEGLVRAPCAAHHPGVIYAAHEQAGMLPSVRKQLEVLAQAIREVWGEPDHPMTRAVRTTCQVLILVSLLTQEEFLAFIASETQDVDALNVFRDEDLAPRTALLVSEDMLTMGEVRSDDWYEDYVHKCGFDYAMRCFPDPTRLPKRSALEK